MTNDQIKAAIIKALKKGPKHPAEIRDAIGAERQKLANNIKALLRTESISRVEISKGRWIYYIGKTAPGWAGYAPQARKEPVRFQHKIPVIQIEFAADCGRTNRVTLPAFPADVRA